jgi:3-oxoacyl-[acyl-carrier-protein] synthase II
MNNEIHCSTVTIAASFDLGRAAPPAVVPEPPSGLAALVRRYRSVRSAVVVQAIQGSLQRAGSGLPDPGRRGIALGTATGAGPDIEEFLEESIRRGDHLVNPALFPGTVHNAAAGNAAIAARCRGPNVVVSAGNESAWSALSAARALVQDGCADFMFVGGFESRRLADGTTGTVAALIAISTDPAILGGTHLAPLSTRARRADGPPDDTGAAGVAALLGFAGVFAPEPAGAAKSGGVAEAEAATR